MPYQLVVIAPHEAARKIATTGRWVAGRSNEYTVTLMLPGFASSDQAMIAGRALRGGPVWAVEQVAP